MKKAIQENVETSIDLVVRGRMFMKTFRNFLSAGLLAVVVFGVLFTGACKKKENNDDKNNAILLLLATQPYVEQSKTGFFIIVPKGIAQ